MLITRLERLDLLVGSREWPYARENAALIAAHFAAEAEKRPLWNGQLLLMHDWRIDGANGVGQYFQTDFASFLTWRDLGFADPDIRNGFGMAALRSAEGHFVLGEMAGTTANAGKVYFPAGTPDPLDVRGDRLDMEGSVRRELAEETGLGDAECTFSPEWVAVDAGPRLALMKPVHSRLPAEELARRILAHGHTGEHPEFSAVRMVRTREDFTEAMPPFIRAYLDFALAQG